MATIRRFESSDVSAVAALMRENMDDWRHDEQFLTGTLIDYPWADDELSSLVAVDDSDEVIGFVGAQVRRLRLGERPLRGICVSHLVVAPGKRAGAAGALLLSRLLSGPQDLSWSDSANDAVVRMWATFGGHVDHARVCDWMLVLRPLRWFRGVAGTAVRSRPVSRKEVPVGALPLHAGMRIGGRAFPDPDPDVTGAEAEPQAIVDLLATMARDFQLRVDYDAPYLDHTFRQVEEATAPLVRRLVRRGERPVGWYAYLELPAGVRRVLHLAAPAREREAVMGRLIAEARADGATVLTGRLEPGLEDPLHARLAVLGLARKPVIHTHDPEVRAVVSTSSSLLTQLDSEWYVT
jgi:hypothetical protein